MSQDNAMDENQLREIFDANFERLRHEFGHSLAPNLREDAWEQVWCYWLKLRSLAESVTDTEVKLSLPNQTTPRGRRFAIEGVVDIVREEDRVAMYDLKTHDLEFVRANIDLYADQLNVYAHIWQNLRGEPLDETNVIATPVPDSVRAAIRNGDRTGIQAAMSEWDPIVPIEFDPDNVEKTIAAFAEVVDQIEDHEFKPPSVAALNKKEGQSRTFASRVCSRCDVRFSCSSFREYSRRSKGKGWRKFADFYDVELDEPEALQRFIGLEDGNSDGRRGPEGA